MSDHLWSEDEVELLVDLYRYNDCLWNVNKPSYNNKELREGIYIKIGIRLGIQNLGPVEIENKILSLQKMYHEIKKKYENSPVCPSTHVGKWYLHMDHIVKFTTPQTNALSKLLLSNPSEASSSTYFKPFNNENEQTDQEVNYKSSSLVTFISRIEIMNVLRRLYLSKNTQSYKIVHDVLTNVVNSKDKCLTSSEESCAHEMTKLGYVFKETIDGKNIIIEDPELRFERYLYLTKCKHYRTIKKPIIFVDERIINLTNLESKNLISTDGLPESNVLFLAITENAVLNCLFSSEANEADFNKWVTGILLNLITVPSVIVMDNSAIHGKLEETCHITRYSTKNEMLKWLIDNDIPCSPKTSRPQLFELIRENKKVTKEYKIDRIIRSHGHEVLRLPKTFTDLNMTDIFWDVVTDTMNSKVLKKAIIDENSLQVLPVLLSDHIFPSISSAKWREMQKTLKKMQNEVYQGDVATEHILASYVFM